MNAAPHIGSGGRDKNPARDAERNKVRRRSLIIIVLAGAVILALASAPALAKLAADWYWFTAIGFETVFLQSIGTRIGLGSGIGVIAFAFFYVNLRLAQRGVVPDVIILSTSSGTQKIDITNILRRLSLPTAAILGLLMALSGASNWLLLLRYLHRTPFGAVDPVFGRDIGYYVFTLPAVASVLQLVVGLTVLALLITVPLYVLRKDILLQQRRVTIEPSAERHLAVLLAILFASIAANAFLVRLPSLVYSTTGPLFGASYTDLAVRKPLFLILGVVAIVGAVLVLVGSRGGKLVRSTAIAAGTYIGVSILGAIATAMMQSFIVKPNELVKETPQLEHHIAATQRAWGLDAVTTRDLTGEATLTLADIEANAGTIRNVRLWDRDPLAQTFRQIQEIRTYYDFRSVDDDRYWIDGEYRQVLLSPRELNSASLPNRNFINEHLQFTHGMGITLSPVNEVSPEGLPVLFIKDLPPASTVSLNVTRPGIYYGETPGDYVFVNTQQPEFDYPPSVFTVYDGSGGVPVNSFLRKLIMSLRFGSLDVFLTDLITRDSRVLYHRNITERASKALPFLRWDADPYIVVTDDGHLKWILDAYTASGRYPYSLPVGRGTNYMRNSVKVVIDAYDGNVEAYIVDPNDPIIETYARIFEGLFRPIDDMPADLRAHVRVPSDLFRIQTGLYTTYHMDEPDNFYAREDQWQIPNLTQSDAAASGDAFLRHIVMRLPGETQEEYITMTPFTPRQKDNLAAWIVARSDGEHYGQLIAYRFPRQSLVFGPTQIVNRINQDTEISRQISLWDQRGSEVIRGNLLVIPIEESLIFIQAIYLRAEGGRIPELKRVIVAYQNQVVMEETLAQGMALLFGGTINMDAPSSDVAPVAAAAAVPSGGGDASARAQALIDEASSRYDAAIAAQQRGDWARYGDEMRRVGELLQQLRSLIGQTRVP